MGRKSRKPTPEEHRDAAEYYKLNTKAVEDLVTADKDNSPRVSDAELRRYRSGPKIRLKDWVKVTLVKWWFAGTVCFFFFWGLGMMIPSMENQLIVLGIGLGLVTDLLTNSIFRYYAKRPGANDRWMMVPRKGVPGLALNIVYAFALIGLIVMSYNVINTAIVGFTGEKDSVPLAVEPILFGLLATGWDFLLLRCKRVFLRIVDDAKNKAK